MPLSDGGFFKIQSLPTVTTGRKKTEKRIANKEEPDKGLCVTKMDGKMRVASSRQASGTSSRWRGRAEWPFFNARAELAVSFFYSKFLLHFLHNLILFFSSYFMFVCLIDLVQIKYSKQATPGSIPGRDMFFSGCYSRGWREL
jgi:hypothetical protein